MLVFMIPGLISMSLIAELDISKHLMLLPTIPPHLGEDVATSAERYAGEEGHEPAPNVSWLTRAVTNIGLDSVRAMLE